MTNNETNVLITVFLTHLAKNNNCVYVIKSYEVKDTETLEEARRKGRVAFSMSPIGIETLDFKSKPGFAVINNEIDFPLSNTHPRDKDNYYLYDKELAEEKVVNLNNIQVECAIKEVEELQSYISYLKKIAENKQY